MAGGAGFQPAKASFTALLNNGADGVSLPFIARGVANKTHFLQVVCRK
jgi:hypothetical protein